MKKPLEPRTEVDCISSRRTGKLIKLADIKAVRLEVSYDGNFVASDHAFIHDCSIDEETKDSIVVEDHANLVEGNNLERNLRGYLSTQFLKEPRGIIRYTVIFSPPSQGDISRVLHKLEEEKGFKYRFC